MRHALTEASLAELSADAWRLIDACEVVITDLDGCLAADNVPLPGAHELARRAAHRLIVASNNSTHTAQQLAEVLRRNGLSVAPERLVLAGEVAIGFVARQHPGARVMLLGSDAICEAARAAGLQLVDEAPQVVLLTRAVGARIRQLEAAIAALHAGAALVVANPDLSHPGAGGVPRIETGALLALLRAVLPQLSAVVIGKPERAIFEAALALDQVPAERALMIGDNATTDIEGARRLGLHTIHLAARRQAQAAPASAAGTVSAAPASAAGTASAAPASAACAASGTPATPAAAIGG